MYMYAIILVFYTMWTVKVPKAVGTHVHPVHVCVKGNSLGNMNTLTLGICCALEARDSHILIRVSESLVLALVSSISCCSL